MTAQSRRQLLMLAALAAVLAIVVWARRDRTPAGGAARASNPARAANAPAANSGTVADVRLELLEAQRAELAPAERNPFRFQARATPTPPRPPVASTPVVTAPPVPAGPPPPPPIALKFIGVFDLPNGTKLATFSDGRGSVFTGKEGDIIEGRYQVLKIGTESADLAYVDGRGRQTIRLSGQ